MVEKIVVIILVVAAATGWILYAKKESNQSCEGCGECKLKETCKKKR